MSKSNEFRWDVKWMQQVRFTARPVGTDIPNRAPAEERTPYHDVAALTIHQNGLASALPEPQPPPPNRR
jgi:hypothetical protein